MISATVCYGLFFGHSRSSHRRCSVKRGVLKNFAKVTGKKNFKNTFFTEHIWQLLLDEVFLVRGLLETLSKIYNEAFWRKLLTPKSRWLFSQKSSIIGVWESPEFTSGCSLNFSVFKKAGNNSEVQRWYSNYLLVASALSIFTSIPICCNYWQSLYHSLNLVSLLT